MTQPASQSLREKSLLFKTFSTRLRKVRGAMIELHRQKTSIETVVATTSLEIDTLLIDAWTAHFKQNQNVSLLAVGGYGRRELNIYSDIDLLFLHDFSKQAEAHLDNFGLDTFIQFLWDIGLEVGHSVRTIDECLEQAKDISIMTNMLESRLLIGSTALFERFDTTLRNDSIWTDASFFNAKVEEQHARHERFDETTYKLEPNIKKSPGCLRDIQTISWIANKLYGTSDPDSLMSLGLLTEDELRVFKSSRNYLWAIRNVLHIQANRAEDRLLFEYQQDISSAWGLKDKPGLLAIEQLMQRYYRAAHDIRSLNELILQLIDEKLHLTASAKQIKLSKFFYLKNSYLYATNESVFSKHPSQLLEVFALYQQHHQSIKGFGADCARAIRQSLPLIDTDYQNNPTHLKTFTTIFKHENGLTHTLRKMHETGILSAFLPAFGKIKGQMQHDLFHAYTVDAHTLMLIRNLRRCMLDRYTHELPEMSQLMQNTKKRYRLYLAGLFHDIAKGRGGNHDKRGAVDAREFSKILGLATADIDLISWLVLNHLKMSKVSQREDLSNPEVIEQFARMVGDQEHLDNLYLLTVADIRATSATTWTAWKGHLLKQLYAASTKFYCEQQSGDSDDALLHLNELKTTTLTLLDSPVRESTLDLYWQMLDDDYFHSYTPKALAWHANSICNATALDLPIVKTRYLSDLDAEQYLIYTGESAVLLTTATSVIDRFSQNIVQARIHAANPGFTILIFTVTSDSELPNKQALSKHANTMRQALLQSRDHKPPIKKLLPRRLKEFAIEPIVKFSKTSDKQATVLSLTALDQPGLIHLFATALAKCRIRLLSAHIATVGEKAKDQFILCQPNNRKTLTNRQKTCLRSALLKTLR